MKKTLLLALLLSPLTFHLSPLTFHLSPLQAQSPRRYAINFESHNGESFNVFIDGEIANRMPQSRVMVNDISDREASFLWKDSDSEARTIRAGIAASQQQRRLPQSPFRGDLHLHFTSN